MVVEIREHIKLRGDNPLDATVAGTHYKAYLVANLALNDGPQAAADTTAYRWPRCTARWSSTVTMKPRSIRRSAKRANSESSWALALRNLPSRR